MKNDIGTWMESNFNRHAKSMPGSCITVSYVPKAKSKPLEVTRKRKATNWRSFGIAMVASIISVLVTMSLTVLL